MKQRRRPLNHVTSRHHSLALGISVILSYLSRFNECVRKRFLQTGAKRLAFFTMVYDGTPCRWDDSITQGDWQMLCPPIHVRVFAYKPPNKPLSMINCFWIADADSSLWAVFEALRMRRGGWAVSVKLDMVTCQARRFTMRR